MTVVSAVSSISGGISSMQQGKAMRREYEDAAKDARTRGLQQTNMAWEELQRNLALQEASSAVGGSTLGESGTSGFAQRKESERQFARDAANIQFNAATEARRFEIAGENAATSGEQAFLSGIGNAASSVGNYFLKKKTFEPEEKPKPKPKADPDPGSRGD